MSSVYHGADLSDVGFPCSARFAVGMGDVVAERDTLSAVHTFCHLPAPPLDVWIISNKRIYLRL